MHKTALDGISLFAGLTGEERAELAHRVRVRDIPAREAIFWMGDAGDDFYVIRSGKVEIVFPDSDGREITLAVLGAGDFLGEVALLDGGPRTATARAGTEVSLFCLSREEFHDFLKQSPSASLHVIQVLSRRQRESLDKLRGIKNLNEVMEENLTAWQQIAHTIASMAAGRNFLMAHVAVVSGWIVLNLILGKRGPDPFPFSFLCFCTSCEAIFLSLFILISQDAQGRKDRLRTELEYQVAMKAQLEIMHLHRKIDELPGVVKEHLREARNRAGDGDGRAIESAK